MNVGSVVQIGGAVRHNPLPLLVPQNEPTIKLDESTTSKTSSQKSDSHSFLGGFIGGGQLAWRAAGPTIEVIDPFTCTRQAAWTFGAILHNENAKITCVCGIGVDTVTHVVVGIDLGSDHSRKGMVGVLSLRRSRITRAFQFQHKVTKVCMVTGGDKIIDPSTLAPELRSCQGLLAVATGHASLYLVDLALDLGADKITSDEVSPASFCPIVVPDPEADFNRNDAISRDQHPILCLSNTFSSDGEFKLLGPDDNVLFEAPSQTVFISSILYIPQLASLAVGYSFGAFQIINLSLITVDCASPYEENVPPVFAFAYQEPENDPRSFVYLWVCRSLSNDAYNDPLVNSYADRSTCSLYAMNYEKKEWIEGHGLWYQCLQSMSPRFDFEASAAIAESVHSSSPSKTFCAMTVLGASKLAGSSSPLAVAAADMMSLSDEEADPVPELSLCMFGWEGSYLERGRNVTQHYVAVFDINQWYQAQMPSHLRLDKDSLCPFMSFHIMDKVPKSLNEKLLSASSKMGSWSRYSSKSTNENTWFPASLSYELHLLTSEGLVTYRCPSVQQSAISALMMQGPGVIVNPSAAYNTCMFAGIVPSDMFNNLPGSSAVCERKYLLDIALEHNLLSLIIQCVIEFSEGRFAHVGCSLQLLLDWAWDKIRLIKESYDNLCFPLFSFTCGPSVLSYASLNILHQHLVHLTQLCAIIGTIQDHSGQVTQSSARELEGRVQIASLLKLYLQAVLWFYHCGLLPQSDVDDVLDGKAVPFPDETLRKIYDDRRSQLSGLSKDNSDLLLIDSIIAEGGPLLKDTWHTEGESGACYPPPSLHALLSMYLLPAMTTQTKNRIIQYLFLDLASLLSDNFTTVVEELVQFPSSFSMSPSIIKLTQAFWMIDQKDFETGLSVLLDPLVNPDDITQEQHRIIIKAFLLQEQTNHAMTYIEIRQPPEQTVEDIRLNLTVLLANGRIIESFHYQRHHRVASNTKDLLLHLFSGCEQLGRLESIVHLPLSITEEEVFIQYLKNCNYPSAQDILLVYYLQQSRFNDISCINDGFRNASTSNRHNTRAALVEGYLSHLPSVRSQTSSTVVPKPDKRIYTKPLPLSARVRHSSLNLATPLSKAKRYAIQEQNKLPPTKMSDVPYTPFRSKAQRKKANHGWNSDVFDYSSYVDVSSRRETTCLVFPTTEVETKDTNDSFLLNSNAETSFLTSTKHKNFSVSRDTSSLQEEISKVMEKLLQKSRTSRLSTDNNYQLSNSTSLSMGMVSLLKTPPVSRRRSFIKESSSEGPGTAPETPQSILKVRKILQQSQSSIDGFDSPASSIPSFPLQRPLLKSLTKEISAEKSLSESGSMTPKLLRFELPSRRLSVDDDNAIVNEIPSHVVSKLELDVHAVRPTPLKRKWSSDDQSSPDRSKKDQPTPRKPMPNFVPSPKPLSQNDVEEHDSDGECLSIGSSSPNRSELSSTDAQMNEDNSSSMELQPTEDFVEEERCTGDEKDDLEKSHPKMHRSYSSINHVSNGSLMSVNNSPKIGSTSRQDSLRNLSSFSNRSPTAVNRSPDKSASIITDEAVEAAKNVVSNLFNIETSCQVTSSSPEKEEGENSACEESFHSVEEPSSPIDQTDRNESSKREVLEKDTEQLFDLTKTVVERSRRLSEVISLCSSVNNSEASESLTKQLTVEKSENLIYVNGENKSDSCLEVNDAPSTEANLPKMEDSKSDGDLDSMYVLTFSDSDDSDSEVKKVSLSRADTLVAEEDSIQNGRSLSSSSLASSRNLCTPDVAKTITNLPSEFENMPPMFLTLKENQVIESVLKGKDGLVNDFEFKRITKPTYTPKKSKNLDNLDLTEGNITVIAFSDDEDDVFELNEETKTNSLGEKKVSEPLEINSSEITSKSSEVAIDAEKSPESSNKLISQTIVSPETPPTHTTEQQSAEAADNLPVEISSNNNNVNKEGLIMSLEQTVQTPIRRSRRLSEISLGEDVPATPTSVRRSRRLSGMSCGDQNEDVPTTPSSVRRSRRLSESTPVNRSRRLSESTPVRRSRRLSESTPVNRSRRLSESTPVRRSRRLSESTPVNRSRRLSESTPVRRSRRLSESTPSKCPETRERSDSVSSEVTKDLESVGTPEKLPTLKRGRRKSLTSNESCLPSPLVESTVISDVVSALPPLKEVNVTPIKTPSRRGRKKSETETTPNKFDTPRRSARISSLQQDTTLDPILENEVAPSTPIVVPVLLSPSARKTPSRSTRRRSINPDLETIPESTVVELSPLSSTAAPTVRSIKPSTPKSVGRNKVLRRETPQRGRKKSASVSPKSLSKTSRVTRRSSTIEEQSPIKFSEDLKELEEDAVFADVNYTKVPDQEMPSQLLAKLTDETRKKFRKSTAHRKSSISHLSSVSEPDVSLEMTVNKRTRRRKTKSTLVETESPELVIMQKSLKKKRKEVGVPEAEVLPEEVHEDESSPILDLTSQEPIEALLPSAVEITESPSLYNLIEVPKTLTEDYQKLMSKMMKGQKRRITKKRKPLLAFSDTKESQNSSAEGVTSDENQPVKKKRKPSVKTSKKSESVDENVSLVVMRKSNRKR